MKTSVIVTCYNHEKLVLQALDSVLNNRIEKTELIVCDDASSDESVAVVDRWLHANQSAFDRVVFIKNTSNYGVTNSLNTLISECRGELISPLASDDYYLEGAIRARQSALCSNPHWLGAFSDGIAVGLKGESYTNSILNASGIENHSLNPQNISNTVLQKWVEPMNLQFWRRSAFKAHGGEFIFDGTVFCEDLNFALWAVARAAFGFIDTKCYAYRCRSWPQSTPGETEGVRFKKMMDMANCYKAAAKSYSFSGKKYLLLKYEYYFAIAHNNYQLAIHLEKTINNECKDTILLKMLRMMGVKYYSNQ